MNTSDSVLVARIERGEIDQAFSSLYDEFADRLLGLCRSMVRADLDDAFQEVLLAIYRALPRYRGESSPFTWCYRIAVRVTLRHVARSRATDTAGGTNAVEAVPAADLDVMQAQEEVARIERAVDALPLIYRLPIVLHARDGLSATEIAEVCGITTATVWTRLHRARTRLAAALEPGGDRDKRCDDGRATG